MKVKRFTAHSMKEAMEMVKRELGSDAVILQTRQLPKSFLGFFSRNQVEITAAADVPAESPAVERQPAPGEQSLDGGQVRYIPSGRTPAKVKSVPEKPDNKKEEDEKTTIPLALSKNPARAETATRLASMTWDRGREDSVGIKRLSCLEDKIAKLTETVEALVEKSVGGESFSGRWMELFKDLLRTGMEESLARETIHELKEIHPDVDELFNDRRLLEKYYMKQVKVSPGVGLSEEGQKVVVLIGPTGVGKTTTLAKIAASFLSEGKSLAFVTADTYRLAAVEQLEKYADIMNLSLETVYSPREMEEAIAKHSDKDLVFVDTAGRSQYNKDQMEELESFLASCQPAEVHLLLSATTKREDLEEILEKFSSCPVDRLILTKSDESTCYGPFYSVVRNSPIPFSYITTGQIVPEDIEEASEESIARLLCYGCLMGVERLEESLLEEEQSAPVAVKTE